MNTRYFMKRVTNDTSTNAYQPFENRHYNEGREYDKKFLCVTNLKQPFTQAKCFSLINNLPSSIYPRHIQEFYDRNYFDTPTLTLHFRMYGHGYAWNLRKLGRVLNVSSKGTLFFTKLTDTKGFMKLKNYHPRITSIKVNGKNAYELKGKFLDDLHNNAFSGTNREDAVEHIEYFLRIVDLIDLPNVNQDKLRVLVFPVSLGGNAWKWFDEIKGSINRWVDLTAKFFGKYYSPSCTRGITTTIIKWDPTNPSSNTGSDDTELTNEKGLYLEEECSRDVNETAKIFKIKDDLLDYETPLCKAFNKFNYLLKIDMDLFTFKIQEIKTYKEYELDNNMTGELGEPWSKNGIPYQLCDHICEPYRFKNGMTTMGIRVVQILLELYIGSDYKARILELKRRNMKKTNFDIQYAVSIKKDTAYLCLHFTKDHEGNKINTPYPENLIRRIQVIECEDSGR
ncbi:hypothetical protein Tco_0702552 [Tanacetum coccineum]|uniref:Retrotransposon gag domain-containing protein n=1 Tax=Tanacetum coccineum TaxID=301880 RepID=A0ABQ4XX67_9ASTR